MTHDTHTTVDTIDRRVDDAVAEFRAGYQAWLDYIGEPEDDDGPHYNAGWQLAAYHSCNFGEPDQDSKLAAAAQYRRDVGGE